MYEYLDESKSNLAVNTTTGEVTEAVTVIIPIGSTIYTPEQKRAYKERKAKEAEKERRNYYRRKYPGELGYFYFVMNEHRFGNISAESAVRLLYLCTYLNFENEFMISQRQKMKKSDLKSILGLSTGTTFNFWKEVNGTYIIDLGDDGLKLNCSEIVRGAISDSDSLYKKIYIDAIRNIYKATPTSKHKHLGYVFKLLPFINTEYNIICDNPEEKELKKIKPLSVADICDIIDYDKTNLARFMKIYRQITFDYKGQQEYFLTFVTNKGDADSTRAFVNPHILYSGSDFKKVEVLGAFVKVE